MPGLCLLFGLGHDRPENISRLLSGLAHGPEYETRILHHSPRRFVGASVYPGYPLRTWDGPDFFLALEGCLHHLPEADLEKNLLRLASRLTGQGGSPEEAARSWLLDADGEFVFLALDKASGRAAVLTDSLGLLPVYLCQNSRSVVLAREMRFLAAASGRPTFDRLGLAQALLLGYPLGLRTLWEGVERLPPAALVRLDPVAGKVTVQGLVSFNHDHRPRSSNSLEANAADLAEILVEVCRRRRVFLAGRKNVLGLSGGFDSRAVALALQAAEVPFEAVTFSYQFHRGLASDLEVAGQLAQEMGLAHRVHQLPAPLGREALRLLRHKAGLNFLGQSHMIRFLSDLKAQAGPDLTYLTGDTGLALRPFVPTRPVADLDELVAYVLNKDGIIPLARAAGLVRMRPRDLRESLREELAGYPEADLAHKYTHLIWFCRVFKWNYEGMDRNRGLAWLAAPLESFPLAAAALACPAEQKAGWGLYRHLLARLSPQAARLKIGVYGAPAGSPRQRFLASLRTSYDRLPWWVRRPIRKYLTRTWKAYPPEAILLACLKGQLSGSPAVAEIFDAGLALVLLPGLDSYQTETLFTLTSAVEDLTEGASSLERYLDQPLF